MSSNDLLLHARHHVEQARRANSPSQSTQFLPSRPDSHSQSNERSRMKVYRLLVSWTMPEATLLTSMDTSLLHQPDTSTAGQASVLARFEGAGRSQERV